MKAGFWLVVLALGAQASFAGTIVGRVELLEKGGRRAEDVSGAVVYVDGFSEKVTPMRVAVTMKDKEFVPRQVVVPVGSTVEFPNRDSIFHNVFSVSGANRFDLSLYKRPKTGAYTFQYPGIVRVYCNIHPQMSAIVIVRDNEYFATAGSSGAFRIDGVPAGRRRLVAWHERTSESVREVSVPENGTVEALLSLDGTGYRRVKHKNKFGKDYAGDDKY